jgi:hypothetical protein
MTSIMTTDDMVDLAPLIREGEWNGVKDSLRHALRLSRDRDYVKKCKMKR